MFRFVFVLFLLQAVVHAGRNPSTLVVRAELQTADDGSTLRARKVNVSSGDGTLKAATPVYELPANAATFKPPSPPYFNMAEFNQFVKDTAEKKETKAITVKPGEYTVFVDESVDGYNQVIEIAGLRGEGNEGWVVDFRGSTFNYPEPVKETEGNPPSAIYVAQCNDLTILGGTFWLPEPYSQGVVKSKVRSADGYSDAQNDVTIVVDEGYDMGAWNQLDSSTLATVDARDRKKMIHLNQTMRISEMKLNKVDNDTRTVEAYMNNWSGFEVGMHMSVAVTRASYSCLTAEMDSNLVVKGMTTNAAFNTNGLHANELSGEPNKPQHFIDCVITNAPLPKGMAPRVNGPTISVEWPGWANFDNWGDNHIPNSPDPDMTGSIWQMTGNVQDTAPCSQKEPDYAPSPPA